jgi:hypothetical protein
MRGTVDSPIVRILRASPAPALALAFACAALLAAHQHLIDVAMFAQRGVITHSPGTKLLGPDFYQTLPYPVLDNAFGPPTSVHLALIAVGALESAVLFALYRVLRDRPAARMERAGLALAAVAMLLLALHARALIGFDLYAYLGYAKLATLHAAYAPPPVRFPGAFGTINDVWGTPLVTSYYGPLWIALDRLAVGGATTLGGALHTLRLIEVVPFAIVAGALAMRGGVAFIALFALDPVVHVLYLTNGHNDLVGIALVLVALALVRRFPLFAALLAGAAGLVKLPFAATALLVFAGRGALAPRAAWVLLAFAVAGGGSLLLGGTEYAHDLAFRLHQVNQVHVTVTVFTGKAIRTCLLLVALFALAAAFARGIVWRSASWSFAALSSTVYPWYLAAALPYAALERGALASFLILFPLAAALLENAFPHLGLGQVVMLVMLLSAAYEIVRAKSRTPDVPLLGDVQ